MNGPLSDVPAEILAVLGDSMGKSVNTLCLSTEEMCHCLQSFNQTVEEGGATGNVHKPVIFSMDVAAMYPSLDVSIVAKAIGEEFVNADLEINVDERKLTLYLAVIFQKERRKEVLVRQLHEIILERKYQTVRRILMSTEEILDRSEKTLSKFQETRLRDPDRREVRQIIGLTLEEAVKTAIQNHLQIQWNCKKTSRRWGHQKQIHRSDGKGIYEQMDERVQGTSTKCNQEH